LDLARHFFELDEHIYVTSNIVLTVSDISRFVAWQKALRK